MAADADKDRPAWKRLGIRLESVGDWTRLVRWQRKFEKDPIGTWIFRGEKSGGRLRTSLEKAFHANRVPKDKKAQVEKGLVREFKRHAHRLLRYAPPADYDTLEWLALMQHYGAPTRMLDWT
jgi:hypothetical protein